MSFNEQDRFSATLRGQGWRRLVPVQTVQGYVASTWIDVIATEVNDETHEIRIAYPVSTRALRHVILDASQYRPRRQLFYRDEAAQRADVVDVDPA